MGLTTSGETNLRHLPLFSYAFLSRYGFFKQHPVYVSIAMSMDSHLLSYICSLERRKYNYYRREVFVVNNHITLSLTSALRLLLNIANEHQVVNERSIHPALTSELMLLLLLPFFPKAISPKKERTSIITTATKRVKPAPRNPAPTGPMVWWKVAWL